VEFGGGYAVNSTWGALAQLPRNSPSGFVLTEYDVGVFPKSSPFTSTRTPCGSESMEIVLVFGADAQPETITASAAADNMRVIAFFIRFCSDTRTSWSYAQRIAIYDSGKEQRLLKQFFSNRGHWHPLSLAVPALDA